VDLEKNEKESSKKRDLGPEMQNKDEERMAGINSVGKFGINADAVEFGIHVDVVEFGRNSDFVEFGINSDFVEFGINSDFVECVHFLFVEVRGDCRFPEFLNSRYNAACAWSHFLLHNRYRLEVFHCSVPCHLVCLGKLPNSTGYPQSDIVLHSLPRCKFANACNIPVVGVYCNKHKKYSFAFLIPFNQKKKIRFPVLSRVSKKL